VVARAGVQLEVARRGEGRSALAQSGELLWAGAPHTVAQSGAVATWVQVGVALQVAAPLLAVALRVVEDGPPTQLAAVLVRVAAMQGLLRHVVVAAALDLLVAGTAATAWAPVGPAI